MQKSRIHAINLFAITTNKLKANFSKIQNFKLKSILKKKKKKKDNIMYYKEIEANKQITSRRVIA